MHITDFSFSQKFLQTEIIKINNDDIRIKLEKVQLPIRWSILELLM